MKKSLFTVDVLEAKDYLHNLAIEWGRWDASYMSFWPVVLARNRLRFAVIFSDPRGGRRPKHVFSATNDHFRPILIHLCDRLASGPSLRAWFGTVGRL